MYFLEVVFLFLSLSVSNILTFLLLKYHSSILYTKRNILTYMNCLLIVAINVSVTVQVDT